MPAALAALYLLDMSENNETALINDTDSIENDSQDYRNPVIRGYLELTQLAVTVG